MTEQPVTPEPSGNIQRLTLAVLGGLSTVLVLIIVTVLAVSGTQNPPPRPIVQQIKVAAAGTVTPVSYLSVSPGIKPGTDGQLHDAYSQTTFVVHPGQPVKLVINNTDSVPHGIVSPEAGVNIVAKPGKHTYTLMVKHAGVFEWHCNQPCDPTSMAEMGYMQGKIIAA